MPLLSGRSLNFQNLSQADDKKKKKSSIEKKEREEEIHHIYGVPGVHVGVPESSTSLKDKVKFYMTFVGEANDNTAEL